MRLFHKEINSNNNETYRNGGTETTLAKSKGHTNEKQRKNLAMNDRNNEGLEHWMRNRCESGRAGSKARRLRMVE